jgi:hypothetical protein
MTFRNRMAATISIVPFTIAQEAIKISKPNAMIARPEERE